MHFQQIEHDKIDFDKYILKVEEFFNNFSFEDLKKEFCENEMKFENFYPLMQKAASSMADVHSHTNTLAANRFEKGKEFLEKQGFIIKEESE